jgi:hypothetical protein
MKSKRIEPMRRTPHGQHGPSELTVGKGPVSSDGNAEG